jgi:hypothetical protein
MIDSGSDSDTRQRRGSPPTLLPLSAHLSLALSRPCRGVSGSIVWVAPEILVVIQILKAMDIEAAKRVTAAILSR